MNLVDYSGLALVAVLLLLTAAYFHQHGRRREARAQMAKRVADTLRRQLADMPVHWKDETLHVTASFGVTMAQPSEIDTQALIGRADPALYRAKEQGRNCVRLSLELAVV